MSGWKLVEAVVESDPVTESQQSFRGDQRRNGRSGRGGGRGRSRRNYGRPAERDQQTKDYHMHLAIQQIEYLFSDENLCMDTFLRSYMDEDGFVPIALVCSYQNVSCYGLAMEEFLAKFQSQEFATLEVDLENEKLKRKEKWEMWLMPNGYGGRGVPRYVKVQIPEGAPMGQEYYSDELSAGATEFTPSDAFMQFPLESPMSNTFG